MISVIPRMFEKFANGRPLKQVLTEKQYTAAQRREAVLMDEFGKIGMLNAARDLIAAGFCLAPASTCYHGAELGGLYEHSRNVKGVLVLMTEQLGLIWGNPNSPAIVGWLHDLCKTDSYEVTSQNEDGSFVFARIDPMLPYGGHATKSLALCQFYGITLTREEMMCIRFHMGAYEKDDWENLDRAIKQNINVLFTHTADMIASKTMETQFKA